MYLHSDLAFDRTSFLYGAEMCIRDRTFDSVIYDHIVADGLQQRDGTFRT